MAETKKLMSVEELLAFCEMQKFTQFNFAEAGYRLAVTVPTTYEVVENVDDNHRGMAKLKVRVFHDGLNRNGSYTSHEAAEQAMLTIPDRPLMAYIHQLDDGSWDFEAHNIEVIRDEDGNQKFEYAEKQVGSFSSEPAFWEYDEINKKNFVTAYAYIAKEYTRAFDIIQAKGGTKNSCELSIEEMAYNAKEKYIDLQKYYVSASTLLGAHDDGTPIGEGMQGSRADIVGFEVVQEADDPSLLNYNEYSGKEENGTKMNFNKELFESLLAKYSKTVEDIEFEYEELSDEELEAKFAEVFEVEDGVNAQEPEEAGTPETVKCAENPEVVAEPEKFTKTFAISHEDIRVFLYQLIAPFEESDNDWYGICNVWDDHFMYTGFFGGKYWGQKYTVDGDNVALEGERWELFAEFLTASEKAQLEIMRSNYSKFEEISAELEKYKVEPAKMEILNSAEYSQIADSEEFAAFKEQSAHFDLSVEDVRAKADTMLLSYAKQNKLEFATPETKVGSKVFVSTNKAKKDSKKSRYGNLFKNV